MDECVLLTPHLAQESYYLFSLTLSVCISVCNGKLQINFFSFLFLDGIEPFFGHQFSVWHSTKLFSQIFDLGPLTPKVYSPKLAVSVIESVVVYIDLLHSSIGQSVHTKTCMWVGPTLVAMATTSGLGAESSPYQLVLNRNYVDGFTGLM